MVCTTLIVFLQSACVSDGLAQRAFEGIIETKNITIDERGTPQQFTMTMYLKNDVVKIQNSPIGSSPGSTLIYRGDKKVVWMLNDEDKSYFEIQQEEQPKEVYSSSAPREDKPVVRMTGRKNQMLGYKCEQIVIKDDGVETEIWATKSLGKLYATISEVLGGEGNPSGAGWESTILKMGYYPLRASTKVGGKILESQEVTRIEKKSLTRGIFDVPAGYKKQSNLDLIE